MRMRILAILGALIGAFILVIGTLSVNGTTLRSFQQLDQAARQQDKGVASTSAQPCANPRLLVTAPIRVLAQSQTEAISIQVTNQDTVECDITLSLVALNFKLQPADNQRLIALTPTASSTLTWRVAPTAVGLFTLAVTAGNASQQIGFNVVPSNGFIPAQSQTFNYLEIFFGFLLTLASLLAWQMWPNRRNVATKTKSAPSVPAQPPVSTSQPTPVDAVTR
jgi:uncharacterized iron-regulated membrane protein